MLETEGCSVDGGELVLPGDGSVRGNGGAIWNGRTGNLVVKGPMTLDGLKDGTYVSEQCALRLRNESICAVTQRCCFERWPEM